MKGGWLQTLLSKTSENAYIKTHLVLKIQNLIIDLVIANIDGELRGAAWNKKIERLICIKFA